jgi:hypothetical protein
MAMAVCIEEIVDPKFERLQDGGSLLLLYFFSSFISLRQRSTITGF